VKLPGPARRVQDRILRSLGRAPDHRVALVRAMLRPPDGDATGYWLQLTISTMLATLGLALDSTAVVIGAMLIAPLMRPLVEVAMGLATGSAALVLRAVIRTVASICLVTLVALAIAWLLPFHAITAELEARTAPTLLDLVIAGACALAAAYATVRTDGDIATTAAGTSIGISLVPPLCAAGYGLALDDPAVFRGAALLFTANLSGILAIATGVFVLAGFGQVDIRHEEETVEIANAAGAIARMGQAGSRVMTTRLGPLARIVPPLLLIGIVYLPLQRAVREIQRRTEIGHEISHLLTSDKPRVVQYTLDQTASGVTLRAVVVGDAHAASELDQEVRRRLAHRGVESPRVSVWAVPDAASVSALARRLDEIPPPLVPEPMPRTVHRYSTEVSKLLRDAWPEAGTGEVVGVWLDLDHADRVKVAHLGAPIGVAGTQLLARALEPVAGHLEIEEDALVPVEAEPADALAWLAGALDLIRRARAARLPLCVTLVRAPDPKAKKPAEPPDPPGADAVRTVIRRLGDGAADLAVTEGERWSVVPSRSGCAAPAPAAAPAPTAESAPAPTPVPAPLAPAPPAP
jgi:uncharacterized hydrophobic protein (TIGR00271 family)